ncbi:hypothetical protein TRFO_27966 [Tritrichomonas foetus]|uniref:Uncharacterized protein n=1 Tax=Tritrichomonas foetus TaxID=1144522 RepID=A0A1J4JZW4_9EUKA|nr:hypothetical protein TRFO_27966 [Tritrichomonas foetus]|eukprot:OHT04523.1 hypothetical protein TRFO_27966 [Tritrichomonas foetus]
MTYNTTNHRPNQFHLVNIEPYTSEMYSALLQPSLQILEKNYVQYGKKPMSKENFTRSLLIAPIKGVAIGASRSIFTIAFQNINNEYKESPEPKPPIDIFFLKYYTNFKNYPRMLRGLSTELKVECSYQCFKNTISTFSKYLINPKSDNFMTNFGFTFARAFTSNLITATTIYPVSLSLYTNKDSEEIVHKVMKKAGTGSFVTGMITGGISIARSMLPSYKNMFSFVQYMIVG